MDIVEVIAAPRSPWSGSLVRYAGSAWITWSSSTNATCAASCRLTSITTTGHGRIFRWTRIVRSHGQYRRSSSEKSSPSPKSMVCTIATNASRHDSWHSVSIATPATDATLVHACPARNLFHLIRRKPCRISVAAPPRIAVARFSLLALLKLVSARSLSHSL